MKARGELGRARVPGDHGDPRQFRIPDWFLSRQKDFKCKYLQLSSSAPPIAATSRGLRSATTAVFSKGYCWRSAHEDHRRRRVIVRRLVAVVGLSRDEQRPAAA